MSAERQPYDPSSKRPDTNVPRKARREASAGYPQVHEQGVVMGAVADRRDLLAAAQSSGPDSISPGVRSSAPTILRWPRWPGHLERDDFAGAGGSHSAQTFRRVPSTLRRSIRLLERMYEAEEEELDAMDLETEDFGHALGVVYILCEVPHAIRYR